MDNKGNAIKGYITKRPNGLYVVTRLKPQITQIKLSNITDIYITYGDPLGILNIEQDFVDTIYKNVNIPSLDPQKMYLFGNSYPITHYAKKQLNGLYTIYVKDKPNIRIQHICPWFVETLFDEVNILEITPIYFAGDFIK